MRSGYESKKQLVFNENVILVTLSKVFLKVRIKRIERIYKGSVELKVPIEVRNDAIRL